MGMRGSNELAFLLDCGAAHSGRLARGPVFARASQPLCQLPLIHLAHHGTKCH